MEFYGVSHESFIQLSRVVGYVLVQGGMIDDKLFFIPIYIYIYIHTYIYIY